MLALAPALYLLAETTSTEAQEVGHLLRVVLGVAVAVVILLLVVALPALGWWRGRQRRDGPRGGEGRGSGDHGA